MESMEYSATQIRKMLHGLFPQRRLVLSQFTFFNHAGVSRATGSTFRRGRRCYRLPDILPIACILALKEEGIPYKNVESLPALIQDNADRILEIGDGCRLSGFGNSVNLMFPDQIGEPSALQSFLEGDSEMMIFWSFNIGLLAEQLRAVADRKDDVTEERQAA
jgi:DNA-binding transcriptional MerR regulator